jgi:hypothetical protein
MVLDTLGDTGVTLCASSVYYILYRLAAPHFSVDSDGIGSSWGLALKLDVIWWSQVLVSQN